jgi:mono/diheme cytochrome c family protein
MHRLGLALFLTSVLVFPMACGSSGPAGAGKDGGAGKGGKGGSTAGAGGGTAGATAGTGGSAAGATGTAGMDGGADVKVDAPADGDAATDGPVLTAEQTRGQYLVKSVLGCAGCHTPQLAGGGGPDNSKFLSGVECFSKDTTSGGCLNSANLTNDATGIKTLTDQQVKDAFTKGVFPATVDGGTQYLFAQMPYYQFSNLTAADASAIVAYLRSLPAVAHAAPANGGPFATRPTAAQWTPTTLAALPSPEAADGGVDASADAGTTSTTNGKYLAALVCATCHTVNTSAIAPAPLELDATKAFQGGKEFTTTVPIAVADGGADGGTDGGADAATTMSKSIQSANLTPDMTGLKTWTAAQIVTAIKTAKDEAGRSICSPMRAFPGLTDGDALDIANYLKAIPAVANALTETCE